MENFEKTPYETNPVEDHAGAICAFVEAYDLLRRILCGVGEGESGGDSIAFADALRVAMFRPVQPADENSPSLSLYELGVAYVPDGKYGINERKLAKALDEREEDIRALFVQDDGILPNLIEMLAEFTAQVEDDEVIFSAALRFANECRRLFAMWV